MFERWFLRGRTKLEREGWWGWDKVRQEDWRDGDKGLERGELERCGQRWSSEVWSNEG
jgi:hypothetical protein